MKLAISGGHLTPALALIDYIQKHHPQDEIIFIGRKFSQKKLKQKAIEKRQVEKRDVNFIPFTAVTTDLRNLLDLLIKPVLFFKSLIQALKILSSNQPDVFVSFGGYLAVPLAIAAKIKKAPVITHEQTLVAGQASRLVARIANKIAVSFKQTQKLFPAGKTELIGNLLRPQLFEKKSTQPSWFKPQANKSILLVMGGNQGSLAINQAIKTSLSWLLDKYIVIHACGRANQQFDYEQELKKAAQNLSQAKQANYFVRPWISAQDLAWFYQQPIRAVSRAGANTLLELTAFKIPAIYIPLPKANYQEQLHNAQWLTKQNAAIILEQNDLHSIKPAKLKPALDQLEQNYQQLKQNLGKIYLPQNSVEKFYQLIVQVCED